jgi:two-component system KDP operon response regulator KdpE
MNRREECGRVLVVGGDATIRWTLKTSLQVSGFAVEEAENGEAASTSVRSAQIDTVLLDINTPGINGVETCRRLRRVRPLLQILVLSIRHRQEDFIAAFHAGADDYITMPSQAWDLMARVSAAVRRSRASGNTGKLFSVGDVDLNPARKTVRKRGRAVYLTPKEFELLHFLIASVGKPISHCKLLQAVWGSEYGNELHYLHTFIRNLRVKIEDDPSQPVYLLTRSHLGYLFGEPSSTASQR